MGFGGEFRFLPCVFFVRQSFDFLNRRFLLDARQPASAASKANSERKQQIMSSEEAQVRETSFKMVELNSNGYG